MFETLALLGSTGSIGTQTLDVVRHLGGRIRVVALSAAGNKLDVLLDQVEEFQPAVVHIADLSAAEFFWKKIQGKWSGQLLVGSDGLKQLAAECDAELFLLATVGWTGVQPALEIIRRGCDLALANKEALVCAGNLLMAEAKKSHAQILPVDSEHAAIAQCLEGRPAGSAARLVLTCSGGPYRQATAQKILLATVQETLRHPTWEMGQKITVDSATLMNKGFEVIEAHHLFGIPFERIDVVVHPQSIVHSMVEFRDGSLLAQLGITDMKLPIQSALTWPERIASLVSPLRFDKVSELTFEPPDHERFPALAMGYEAGRAGDAACTVLNAANEVAVAAHLSGKITCGIIPQILRATLDEIGGTSARSFEELRTLDGKARAYAEHFAESLR